MPIYYRDGDKDYKKTRKEWDEIRGTKRGRHKKIKETDLEHYDEYKDKKEKSGCGMGCVIALLVIIVLILAAPYILGFLLTLAVSNGL